MADLDSDLKALLAAVDAGQDDCLPVLADLLEETGDERAAGLRALIERKKRPEKNVWTHDGNWTGKFHWWFWCPGNAAHAAHYVLPDEWLRPVPWTSDQLQWAYPTRSGAFLAAAEGFVKAGLT